MAAALTRYLGLAFAAADLLVEVDGTRRVVFAVGARSGADDRLVGRPIEAFLQLPDGGDIAALFSGLRPGERLGPVRVRVFLGDGPRRTADLSIFALPELAPNLSCALAFVAAADATRQPAAALTPQAFQDQLRDQLAAAALRGHDLSLALVEIKGLLDAQQKLPPEDMTALLAKIQGLFAQHAPDAASTGLSVERFAILHEQPGDLSGLVHALGALEGADGAKLEAACQSIKLTPGRDPLHQYRAVRTALECFLSAGLPKDEASLHKSFQAVLEETARSAGRLTTILDERRFDLYYQPVVDLSTEATTHHEVLVRFEKDAGPGPLIKLAEDLAIIERLDALVVEQAARRLRAPGSERLKLAVNVSGATLLSDAFLERLLTTTSSAPGLRTRLQLEITESAALHDLQAASRRIKALREQGFHVAIDDFGAGAASFEYLRALPVSSVKIDGRYVRGVDHDQRAQAIIKHLVGLCGELRYTTVAEAIEREEELAAVSALGVDCGQGWVFGRAEPEPRPASRQAAAQRARRVGEQESWG